MDWLSEGELHCLLKLIWLKSTAGNAELRIHLSGLKLDIIAMRHIPLLYTILLICFQSNLTFSQSPDSSTYYKLKQLNSNANVYYVYGRFNDGSLEYEGWVQDKDSIESKFGIWKHYYKGGQIWRIEDKAINNTDTLHQKLYNKKGDLTNEFSFLLKDPSPLGTSYTSTMDIYSVSKYLSVRRYKHGKLKSIKNWKGNSLKKEGTWLFFNESEKILEEKHYSNGKLLSSKKF
jgi:hypothetical protein